MRFNLEAWKRDSNANYSLDEHHKILAALKERDEEKARAMMLEHIDNARRRIMGTFQP